MTSIWEVTYALVNLLAKCAGYSDNENHADANNECIEEEPVGNNTAKSSRPHDARISFLLNVYSLQQYGTIIEEEEFDLTSLSYCVDETDGRLVEIFNLNETDIPQFRRFLATSKTWHENQQRPS